MSKNYLEHFKQEIVSTIMHTQNNEDLTISSKGAFIHKILNVSSYESISNRWQKHT